MSVTVTRTVIAEYASVREVATLYACSKDCVYAAIRRGELPAVRIGGVLRIPIVALRELPFLAAQED
jgi:excisionase family DNA binding protein